MSKEVLNKIQEDDFKIQEEIRFIDPITKKEFLKIMEVSNEEINNKNCIGNIPKVNMLMQQLPLAVNLSQNQLINNAYKVVFPEGATGTLIKYKNGMLGTPLVNKNKISAHAGLEAIDNISLTPLMIFTAMSALTGQYFMAKIDDGLESINKSVKEIIEAIYDEKESENFSAYNFYEYIKNNIQLILGNEALKLSTLTNLQAINNKMCSNILFFSKSIDRKIENITNVIDNSIFTVKRLSKMEEISNSILGLIKQQHLSYELLCIGKVYEIKVSEMYDEEYYKNVISELDRIGKIVDEDVKKIIDKCEETLLEIIRKSTLKGNEAVIKFKEGPQIYKNKQLEFEKIKSNFIDNIISFKNENIKSKEFIIVDDLIYV